MLLYAQHAPLGNPDILNYDALLTTLAEMRNMAETVHILVCSHIKFMGSTFRKIQQE